jgi:hypothetical protein
MRGETKNRGAETRIVVLREGMTNNITMPVSTVKQSATATAKGAGKTNRRRVGTSHRSKLVGNKAVVKAKRKPKVDAFSRTKDERERVKIAATLDTAAFDAAAKETAALTARDWTTRY